MEHSKDLLDFIRMSKYTGMHNDYAQAGGGNTSVKLDEERMAIKASGYQLTDMTENEGYSIVNYPFIVDYFGQDNQIPHDEKGSGQVLNQSLLEGKRPSIETFLHAITKKFTLHSHPTCVNVMMARKDGMQELKKLFPTALEVEFAVPGILLADKYFARMQSALAKMPESEMNVIFLKNHGVVVTADSADEAIELHEQIVQTLNRFLGMDCAGITEANRIYNVLYERSGNIVYCVRDTDELKRMTDLYGGAGWNWAFAPDSLVYCGKKILDLDLKQNAEEIEEAYAEHTAKYGVPKVAFSKEHYYVFAENLKKAHDIESVLQFCAKVCLFNERQGMDYLSESTQNMILNLDSEKYRQQLK